MCGGLRRRRSGQPRERTATVGLGLRSAGLGWAEEEGEDNSLESEQSKKMGLLGRERWKGDQGQGGGDRVSAVKAGKPGGPGKGRQG